MGSSWVQLASGALNTQTHSIPSLSYILISAAGRHTTSVYQTPAASISPEDLSEALKLLTPQVWDGPKNLFFW